jgi:hypothetical protein
MKKNFIIPDELNEAFDRLMNLVPDRLKNDANTHKAISVYLKLGGEKLAKQCVQVIKSNLPVEERQNMADDKISAFTAPDEAHAVDSNSPDSNDFEFSDK